MSRAGRLIVLSGPSGVGKGTVLARYLEAHPEARASVSATTRAPRPGEEEGVHYFFLARENFEAQIASGGMLEWAQYNNNYYGTPKAPVERMLKASLDVVLEIEVQGAMQVREAHPEAVLVFVAPPDFETLRRRLAGRGTEDEEAIAGRLRTALGELERAGEYDFIVVNGALEQAVRGLGDVIGASAHLARNHHQQLMEVLKDAQTYFVAN